MRLKSSDWQEDSYDRGGCEDSKKWTICVYPHSPGNEYHIRSLIPDGLDIKVESIKKRVPERTNVFTDFERLVYEANCRSSDNVET